MQKSYLEYPKEEKKKVSDNFQIAPSAHFFHVEESRKVTAPRVEKVAPVYNAFVYTKPVMVQVITRRDKGRISIYI